VTVVEIIFSSGEVNAGYMTESFFFLLLNRNDDDDDALNKI
jgi:hypothetical protein